MGIRKVVLVEFDVAWLKGVDGKVFAHSDVLPRMESGSSLSDNDSSRSHILVAISLHT